MWEILALLMTAGGGDFADVPLYYEHLTEHLRWKDLGHVLAGGSEVSDKQKLQEAFELGKAV